LRFLTSSSSHLFIWILPIFSVAPWSKIEVKKHFATSRSAVKLKWTGYDFIISGLRLLTPRFDCSCNCKSIVCTQWQQQLLYNIRVYKGAMHYLFLLHHYWCPPCRRRSRSPVATQRITYRFMNGVSKNKKRDPTKKQNSKLNEEG
jgi:hypothetical protein